MAASRKCVLLHCYILRRWVERKMIGLRVLIEISALNIVVDVGFVTGVTPAITPTGSAISMMPSCSFSRMTPTVLSYLMLW